MAEPALAGWDRRSLLILSGSTPLLATGIKGRLALIDLLKESETHAGIARHGSARQS